ncbi:MAG: tetratricopeptide repeat protein [Caldilineaceae bacterium]|nr:tetratricopeptide repeat protein [Caldilineaceae bacterium]
MNAKVQLLAQQLEAYAVAPIPDLLAQMQLMNDLAWELRYLDPPRATELSQQVQALLAEYPNPREEARTQAILGEIAAQRGDIRQAFLLANRGMQLAEEHLLDDLRPYLYSILGEVHWFSGNFTEALAYFQQQSRAAQQVGDQHCEADALNNMGVIYSSVGEYQLSCETLQRALATYIKVADQWRQSVALNNLGTTLYDAGNYPAAVDYALQSLALTQSHGDPLQIREILDLVGRVYAQQGEYAKALDCFQQCDQLARQARMVIGQATAHYRLGWLYTLQGNDQAALPYLGQALASFDENAATQNRFETHQLLSALHERLGDSAQALYHYKQFHTLKEQVFNEAADRKFKGLQISHQVEAVKQEAEIHRLKNVELQAALAKVKLLSGLLPICANCKKIRDDQGYWHDVAIYVREHSEAEFSHGICPTCIATLYPKSAKRIAQPNP